jgi:DNA-binding beta-propeller fold protein YncE
VPSFWLQLGKISHIAVLKGFNMKTTWFVALLTLTIGTSSAYAGSVGLKVIDTFKIGGTGGWDYANVDPLARKLYVTHGTSIASVDIDTGKVNAHLADANGAHIALPVNDGQTLLLTQGKANKVSFIDAQTGTDLGDIATGAKPDGAIADPATGMVFVLDNGGAQIDAINPLTRTLSGTIAMQGAPEGYAVDGKGLLFTHYEDKNAIAVVDTRTLKIKATYEMPDCAEPTGLALIPDQRLLLSACDNDKARITNADTGALVASLPIGGGADGVAYDEKARLAYIPCGEDGTLVVISFAGKPHIVEVVKTHKGARTLALDPKTGRVYLPFAEYGPPAKAGERPTIIADTFAVLVMGH